MNNENLLLFLGLVLWLALGRKWLIAKINANKDKKVFYATLYKLRYLAGFITSFVLELLLVAWKQYVH